jgi:hypothetical protein
VKLHRAQVAGILLLAALVLLILLLRRWIFLG